MNRFELLYKEEPLMELGDLTYCASVEKVLDRTFRKNTCKFLFDKLTVAYDEQYAEKILDMVKEDKIRITDINRFPYPDPISYDGLVDSYHITTKGYLKANTKPQQNVVNYFIGELESYISRLFKEGRSELCLYDICFTLTLHLIRFNNTKIPQYLGFSDSFEKTSLFNTYLSRLIWMLSINSKISNKQTTTVLFMDKDYYKSVHMNYKLDAGQVTHDIDFDSYRTLQATLLRVMNAANWYVDIVPPNIKAYFAIDYNKSSKFMRYISENVGIDLDYVKNAFKNVDVNALESTNESEALEVINDLLKIITKKTSKTPIDKGLFINDLDSILKAGEEPMVLDMDLHDRIKKYRGTNVEIVYYDVDKVDTIIRKKISETIIDYRLLSSNNEDLTLFKSKLTELYLDAQAINQVKKSICNDKDFKEHYLNVQIENVPRDMYFVVKEVLDKETYYLHTTYLDNFSYNIKMQG